MLSKKAFRVAQRMAAGEAFFASGSPRLSPAIREELRSHGLWIQGEATRYENRIFFPLDADEFTAQLEEIIATRNYE